jgi:pteridine reductase
MSNLPTNPSLRFALVTGGARRVGAAIVRTLIDAGYEVAFTYNGSNYAANALVASLGGRASAIQCDLSRPDAADVITSAVVVPRLHVLVNNASMYLPDAGLLSDQRDAMRRVNVDAPVALVERFAPLLKRSGGCVVNMLDILAERPMPSYSAYCATKASLWNATLSMARLLAPEARAVGIAPGVVDWPDEMPQDARDAYLKRVPLGRAGTPEDVAKLVRFLATEGTYITGQVIRLDGGRSIV